MSVLPAGSGRVSAALLDEFVRDECTPHVHGLLMDAIAGFDGNPKSRESCRFELNRFDVSLDFREREVLSALSRRP
jgi:hypothetical protein